MSTDATNGLLAAKTQRIDILLDELAKQKELNAALLQGLRWAVGQFQGDSGTGHSYWEEFPEYLAAVHALEKAEGYQ